MVEIVHEIFGLGFSEDIYVSDVDIYVIGCRFYDVDLADFVSVSVVVVIMVMVENLVVISVYEPCRFMGRMVEDFKDLQDDFEICKVRCKH